jgi:DNA modification methylase
VKPYYCDNAVTLYHGDCLDVLAELPDASVDSVVTDPPYELTGGGSGGFMGKQWDATGIAFNPYVWSQCLRILKPGGHLLAFGGTRTWHRLAVAVEDAGFEIRDNIAWLYGSGFPKSLDVSKAIDKAAGAEREVLSATERGSRLVPGADAARTGQAWHSDERPVYVQEVTAPATDDAKRWAGWGTALKPAMEPIVVARKPLVSTVAANVLAHGVGALNIDATRLEMGAEYDPTNRQRQQKSDGGVQFGQSGLIGKDIPKYNAAGRWPSNVVLDESQAAVLDEQKGEVSRYFPIFRYQAKAPKKERPVVDGNAHPTVKPLELMRWLVRLVTPPGGYVLDPFAGSGTTGEAALIEGFRCLLIESEADYLPMIMTRLDRCR